MAFPWHRQTGSGEDMTPSVHADPLATRFDPPIDAGPTVMTVLGPVPVRARRGPPHEHLLCRSVRAARVVRGEQFGEPVTLANLGWVRQNWSGNGRQRRGSPASTLAIAELAAYATPAGARWST